MKHPFQRRRKVTFHPTPGGLESTVVIIPTLPPELPRNRCAVEPPPYSSRQPFTPGAYKSFLPLTHILLLTSDYLPTRELANLCATSRLFYHFLTPTLYDRHLLDRRPEFSYPSDVRDFLLLQAVESGSRTAVHHYLSVGASASTVDATPHGWSVLMNAAAAGMAEVVTMLLDAGADLGFMTEEEEAAMHVAARSGCGEIVVLLVSRGADVGEKTEAGGRTPLHFAAETGKAEMVKLLLQMGAREEADIEGMGPAELARGPCCGLLKELEGREGRQALLEARSATKKMPMKGCIRKEKEKKKKIKWWHL